jgi:serine/threonine protein kinase
VFHNLHSSHTVNTGAIFESKFHAFLPVMVYQPPLFIRIGATCLSVHLTKNFALLMMQFCYYWAEIFTGFSFVERARSFMTTENQPDNNHSLSEQITRDYKILRLLGKGGMGEVYLAEQLRVGRRRVALKVLNNTCATNPEMAQRFENEASSAGRINHRNVVTVYESRITDDGQMYVAMEFVEGKSLTEFLKERGPLPLDKVVEITRQMCAGLAAAHKLSIIHRDIKPDNIMITEEDGSQVVKLLDFGIARLSETDPSIGKTRAGVIMGTPTYMSPEQAMGKTGDKIDARSDIYSLGVVIHQMITGHVVFKATSPLEIMRKHISEQPLSLKHWQPDLKIPDAVEEVVLKALQKNRELRQQTIGELGSELEAAVSGISPVVSVSQKDMPTIRVSKEAPTTATVPLSSEKTSGGHMVADTPLAHSVTNPGQQKTANTNQEPTLAQRTRSTAQRSQMPAKPVQPPLPVVPATVAIQPVEVESKQSVQQNDNDSHITSLKPKNHNKQLAIAFVVLVLIFATAFVAIMVRSNRPNATPVLEYRLKRDTPVGDLETLGLDNTIRRGNDFAFEIKLINADFLNPGKFYIFAENSGEKGDSWQWLSVKAQPLRVGEWQRSPLGYAIKTEKPDGLKIYLLVFVPQGVKWSPAEALNPETFPSRNGVAEIGPDIASQIQTSLKQGAIELNATGSQQGQAVSYTLSNKGNSKQVSFYTVQIHQQP